MPPLVSVVIPTYNYAGYIVEAIQSILQQDYPQDQIEVIVVDDGSTDNTMEIVQPFVLQGRVRYFSQSNQGKANATNQGILQATGKYIFNLDADDYFLTDKINQYVSVFETYPEVAHVGSPARIVTEGVDIENYEKIPKEIVGCVYNGKALLSYFYNHCMLFGGGSTFAGRASVLKQIQIPDGVDMYIDEYLILATLNLGDSFLLAEPLSVWRVHKKNYSVGIINEVQKQAKYERLLRSSESILEAVLSHPYPVEIQKLYRLQHEVRKLYFNEDLGKKTLWNILMFAKTCFIDYRYTHLQLTSYSAFNRLLPTFLLTLLRNRKHNATNNSAC